MRTETTQFEASHGRKPRGFGLWWFEITAMDDEGTRFTVNVEAAGMFAEAKADAVREFRFGLGNQARVVSIEVLP